jgi:hypothetical protein
MNIVSRFIFFVDKRLLITPLGSSNSSCNDTRFFYPGTPVSSTNKADRNDITEILLKVTLKTIALTLG